MSSFENSSIGWLVAKPGLASDVRLDNVPSSESNVAPRSWDASWVWATLLVLAGIALGAHRTTLVLVAQKGTGAPNWVAESATRFSWVPKNW